MTKISVTVETYDNGL